MAETSGNNYFGCKPKVSVAVQSDYRENDTQTEPWTPKFRVVNGKPEVLTLGFMKYKRDLPAWRRTIDAIEFMRKKRAWERYLAKTYTPENAKYCRRILTDIEECEMKLMEDDFNRKNQKRLELAAKEADYFNYMMDIRFKEREQFVASEIAKRRGEKIKAIKSKKTRELRKIDMKQRGVNMKYHKLSPVEEMCDPLSPFHVSVARFGKNPRYGTEIMNRDCRVINMSAFKLVEEYMMEKSQRIFEPNKRAAPKKHDCSIVKEEATPEEEALSIEMPPETSRSNVPEPDNPEEPLSNLIPLFLSPHQEKDYQAVLLVQTLIRGRAVQNLMYRGRKKSQDTVDEVQSTIAFFKEEEEEVDLRRRRALQRLRYYHLNMKLIGLVALVQQEMLGEGIADLAVKSHLEVERMTEETRGYLMALLGERTRWHREAAEAGRRQRELRRRDLYNEFFRHLTRRNEISSSFFLKIIEDKVVRAIAEKEADVSTKRKADEIEKKDMEDARRKKHDIVMRREMMARLLHDFYIPQMAKNLERYSMDYYIGKARKTAIDVITERAVPHDTEFKETSLMEMVKHPKGTIYQTATPPPTTPDSSTEPLAFPDDDDDSDEEEDELAKRIEFLDQFMKQETMSVIADAEKFSNEAETFRQIIMKKLRAQEDERRKSMKQRKSSTDEDDKCYDKMYSYDARRFSLSVKPEEEKSYSSSEESAAEPSDSEEDVVLSVSKSSSTSDVIDKRLLVNSDGETTTDSEDFDYKQRQKVLQKYGDMPGRVVDDILLQAQVLQIKEKENLELMKAGMKSTVDLAESSSSELLLGVTEDASAVEERKEEREEAGFEHEEDEELAREIARMRYLDWRDQSDFSNVEWMHQGDLRNTPVSSERITEEGEEEFYGEYEGDESEYFTHDETFEEGGEEEEGITEDEFE